MWQFLTRFFEFLSGEIRNDLARIHQQQENIMANLSDIKAKLEASNATIAEIAGDIAELKDGNDKLKAKVDELQKAVDAGTVNQALVDDIAGLVDAHEAAISMAADDPQRAEITEAVAGVLNKAGRTEEADNVLHSLNSPVMRVNPPYNSEE